MPMVLKIVSSGQAGAGQGQKRARWGRNIPIQFPASNIYTTQFIQVPEHPDGRVSCNTTFCFAKCTCRGVVKFH